MITVLDVIYAKYLGLDYIFKWAWYFNPCGIAVFDELLLSKTSKQPKSKRTLLIRDTMVCYLLGGGLDIPF